VFPENLADPVKLDNPVHKVNVAKPDLKDFLETLAKLVNQADLDLRVHKGPKV